MADREQPHDNRDYSKCRPGPAGHTGAWCAVSADLFGLTYLVAHTPRPPTRAAGAPAPPRILPDRHSRGRARTGTSRSRDSRVLGSGGEDWTRTLHLDHWTVLGLQQKACFRQIARVHPDQDAAAIRQRPSSVHTDFERSAPPAPSCRPGDDDGYDFPVTGPGTTSSTPAGSHSEPPEPPTARPPRAPPGEPAKQRRRPRTTTRQHHTRRPHEHLSQQPHETSRLDHAVGGAALLILRQPPARLFAMI